MRTRATIHHLGLSQYDSLIVGGGGNSGIWGSLKIAPVCGTPLAKKHMHIEWILCTLHTSIFTVLYQTETYHSQNIIHNPLPSVHHVVLLNIDCSSFSPLLLMIIHNIQDHFLPILSEAADFIPILC